MRNFTNEELYTVLKKDIMKELKNNYNISEEKANQIIQMNMFYERFRKEPEHFDFFETEELADLFYDTYSHVIKRMSEERRSKRRRRPKRSRFHAITSSKILATRRENPESLKIKIIENPQEKGMVVAVIKDSQEFHSKSILKKTKKDLLSMLEEKSSPPPHYEHHDGKAVLLGKMKKN